MCAIDHLSTQLTFPIFHRALAIPPTDRWNFPKLQREIVRHTSQGKLVLEMAKWGLEPHWMKPDNKASTFNARNDSLMEGKPMFREAFERKRCLMFATSFVEHTDRRDSKVPIEVVPFEGRPYAYAGLYETAHREEGRLLSCSMITCEPNDLIEPIHSRMPVILREEDWEFWIDPKSARGDLLSLLLPYPSDGMVIRDAVLPPRAPKKKPVAVVQMETLF